MPEHLTLIFTFKKPISILETARRCTVITLACVAMGAVPVAAQDTDGSVHAVLGVGGMLRLDDVVDFRIEDKHLLVANDSRLRHSLTPGLLFRLKWRIDAIVAANLEGQTKNAFDGVMLGIAWRVKDKLSIGGGYVIRIGQELSPGFRSSARTLVDELLENPAYAAEYGRFRCLVECNSGREQDKAYDGFPLVDPLSPNDLVFAGDPIIPSANKSLFFGVFIPLKLQ